MGDGQVSMGDTIVKGNARKVRRVGNKGVIAGFAGKLSTGRSLFNQNDIGATADAMTLFELLEQKLEEHR